MRHYTIAILLLTACPWGLAVPVTHPLSHLHLSVQGLSHIEPHLGLPPAQLLIPLEGGGEEVLKGLSLADEAAIVQKMEEAALHQRLLRVAVGDVDGFKAALVKFQAGDVLTGEFRLSELQEDAAVALDAIFAVAGITHADIWAVVPSEANAGGQSHRPVFSVCASRRVYAQAIGADRTAAELIHALGLVRYDPRAIKYAPDNPLGDPYFAPLPATAYIEPPVGYGTDWQQSLSRNSAPAQSATIGQRVRILLRGDPRLPRVAITIDDGPCPLFTPLILQVLAKEKARANFFVVGEKAEQYPQLLRDIAEAGHLLGNHTYHHRHLSTLSTAEVAAELEACQTVVGRLTGQIMKYLRPPGGSYTEAVLRSAAVRSHIITLWTHNAGDWDNPPVSEIVQRCLRNIQPGAIILMHGGDINSVRALPLIIRGLRARGLEPATLSEIRGADQPQSMTITEALRLPQNGWRPDTVK